MQVDVVFVFDQLILCHLLEIVSFAAQLRQAIYYVNYQMKTIQVVLNPHVKSGSDRAFFLVAVYVQITIATSVREPMYQGRIAVKTEDDVFVSGK